MQNSSATAVRPLAKVMRWWLYLDSFLDFVAGVQLFVLTEQTADFFAWTINPPLTAAFLGASYWSGLILVFLSARRQHWVNARPSVPAVWLFTLLTLIATLIHLDRFHMNTFFGWAWLLIYLVVPVVMPALFFYQQFVIRLPDPPRQFPLPGWLRLGLAGLGAIMLVSGFALFIAPDTFAVLWPWKLTALTGRALAAWLIGIGGVMTHAAWENDLRRVRVVLLALTVLALLQLLAVMRYSANINWNSLSAWFYLLFLFALLIVGLLGQQLARQTGHTTKETLALS
jgi:hypothetical protein